MYESCQKLRPSLFRFASDTEDNEQVLMEILKANDDLSKAMNNFEQTVGKNKKSEGKIISVLYVFYLSFQFYSLATYYF